MLGGGGRGGMLGRGGGVVIFTDAACLNGRLTTVEYGFDFAEILP